MSATAGTMSNQLAMNATLNQMCYSNYKMCTNLPAFYKSLISKINNVSSGNLIFDYSEVDQIVEAAMGEKFPLVSAKRWAITDKKKG